MLLRLKLALHVLRGRPLMYKIHIKDGTVMVKSYTSIVNCFMEGPSNKSFYKETSDV